MSDAIETPTSTDVIRQQLEDLETTVAKLRARKDEVENSIGAVLGQEVLQLEAIHRSMTWRLAASDTERERLQIELRIAERGELLAEALTQLETEICALEGDQYDAMRASGIDSPEYLEARGAAQMCRTIRALLASYQGAFK